MQQKKSLSLSVITPTHNLEGYTGLKETLNSLLQQSYNVNEIIVVVDANPELSSRILSDYRDQENIHVIVTKESMSSNQARNLGITSAKGDIIAFIDDDAIADKNWSANLIDTYQKMDALAVGGKILPLWVSGRPEYLPEELYWLVGVTHDSFAEDKVGEVRNAFLSNLSFRKEVLDNIGYLSDRLGFAQKGTSCLQGDEAELCLRMKQQLGKGVIYNPQALVYHKVPPSKLRLAVLLKRSFYQGYSKALLQKLTSFPRALDTERLYFSHLILKHIPKHLRRLFFGGKPPAEIKQLSVLLLSTLSVCLGFIYGHIKSRGVSWT